MSKVPRDDLIADVLDQVGVLSTRQIQVLAFSLDSYETCKRRMKKLHDNGLVKRIPRDAVSDSYIYYLPKKKFKISSLLEHTLGVNEIYVRVARACQDLGYELAKWEGPEILQPLLAHRTKLAPDAFFQIQRVVDSQPRNAGFFLEFERTVRDSSVLTHKLTRYADLYYSGHYRELFGIRGMRVLVVYASTFTVPSTKRVTQGLATARKLGVTLARFATLEAVTSHSPTELLTAPVWYRPDQDQPVPLFQLQKQEGEGDGGDPP